MAQMNVSVPKDVPAIVAELAEAQGIGKGALLAKLVRAARKDVGVRCELAFEEGRWRYRIRGDHYVDGVLPCRVEKTPFSRLINLLLDAVRGKVPNEVRSYLKRERWEPCTDGWRTP